MEVVASGYSDSIGAEAESNTRADIPIDEMPEVIVNGFPYYPEPALVDHLTGSVWIKSLIDIDGNPLSAKVAKDSGHPYSVGFERSALISAMKNRYTPAKLRGEPIRVWVTFPIEFKLR